MRKNEPLSESQVKNALATEIRRVQDEYLREGRFGDTEQALKYFDGELPGRLNEDVDEPFEEMVSRDVQNAVLSTVAEISPALSGERPVSFKAKGPEDEDAADFESDICSDILTDQGWIAMTTALQDALLQRLGIIETDFEALDTVEYATLTDIPVEQLPEIEAQAAAGGEVEIVQVDGGIETEEGTMFDPGEPVSVKLKQTKKARNLYCEPVPPDEFILNLDHESIQIEDARLVGRQRRVSRSDLIATGFDRETVMALPAYSAEDLSHLRNVRRRTATGERTESGHKSTDLIQTYYLRYKIDVDQDGIAERYRIVAAGNPSNLTILEMEPDNYVPWAAGAAWIWAHQPHGVSLYDRLRTVQDMRSRLWRQLAQANERAIRDRLGVMDDGSVNFNDVAETIFGGNIRMTNPGGLVPIPRSPFPADVVGTLNDSTDRAMMESGGSTVSKTAADNLPTEAGAFGLATYMVSVEESSSQVARTVARTLLAETFKKIHALLRRYGPDDFVLQIGQIDTTQWPARERVKLGVALTQADRQRMVGMLGTIKADLDQQMQQGSPFVSPQQIYRASVDAARLAGVDADAYYIDPSSPEGQQMAQEAQQRAQMAQQEQAQGAEMQMQQQVAMQQEILAATGQMQAQLQEMRAMHEEMKAQADHQRKMVEEEQKQDVDYDKMRLNLVELNAEYDDQEVPDSPQAMP